MNIKTITLTILLLLLPWGLRAQDTLILTGAGGKNLSSTCTPNYKTDWGIKVDSARIFIYGKANHGDFTVHINWPEIYTDEMNKNRDYYEAELDTTYAKLEDTLDNNNDWAFKPCPKVFRVDTVGFRRDTTLVEVSCPEGRAGCAVMHWGYVYEWKPILDTVPVFDTTVYVGE